MNIAEHDICQVGALRKTVSVETWGCQMNVADSEAMLSVLCDEYRLIDSVEDSDLIILNTCHIREKAYHKVVSRLGKLRKLKDARPSLRIVVAGCVAQAEGKKMLRDLPMIDVMLSPGRLKELPQLLRLREQENSPQWALGFHQHTSKRRQSPTGVVSVDSVVQDIESSKTKDSSVVLFPQNAQRLSMVHPGKNTVSRYITIQQGCDNFCTFCVVPYTRGGEVSLPLDEVVQRVERMLSAGAREICLLGQNVNSYGQDLVRNRKILDTPEGPFHTLLVKLLEIEGDWRLRFTTSNPHDLTYGVTQLFAHHLRLGKYFHLPVQSGSDRILEAMKRKVTCEEYCKKISWLKSAVPDISISTDIIVGFPGETDDDFDATYELVRSVEYSFIYAFCYSPRKHTPAQRFSNQVPAHIQSKRLSILLDLQKEITTKQYACDLGMTYRVLFLYASSKEEHTYYGRTLHFRLVKVVSLHRNLVGLYESVLITRTHITTLEGRIV